LRWDIDHLKKRGLKCPSLGGGKNNFELFSENSLTKMTEKNTKRNFGVYDLSI
jgi:hypothetical protein